MFSTGEDEEQLWPSRVKVNMLYQRKGQGVSRHRQARRGTMVEGGWEGGVRDTNETVGGCVAE